MQSFKNNQQIGSNKYDYKDFIKVKETQNYIFLYPNKFSAVVVAKNQLSDDELLKFKTWIISERQSKNGLKISKQDTIIKNLKDKNS